MLGLQAHRYRQTFPYAFYPQARMVGDRVETS